MAAGTRHPRRRGGKERPGRGGCGQRSGPARLGSARSRQEGGDPSGEGKRQPRAGPSFPPRCLCRDGSGTRAPRGCASPSRARLLLSSARRVRGSRSREKPHPAEGTEQQGQGPRPGPQTRGAERPGLGDGSSSTPGSSEAPKERPGFLRVPHPALLNKTRCSKTHK